MFVRKRDGRKESAMFDKITSRIQKLCYHLDMDVVDPAAITLKVMSRIYSGISTVELDNLAAQTAATMSTTHFDYAVLGARIAISNLHKETKKNFSEVISDLYNTLNDDTGKPMISSETYQIVMDNKDQLNSAIIYDRDFNYDYFGFKMLEKDYLMKIKGKVVERPQHMLMRVAVGIHGNNISSAIETYNLMSENWFIHAPSILLNAGTPYPYMASSFLMTMKSDSIDGIYESFKECTLVSGTANDIGFNVHCIRASGSYIRSTNGTSNGLVPMLRVYNECPGNLCIYLEPWHSDIFSFLDLKKSTGKEEARARKLSYALWIPDLFMKRVEKDEMWSLMSPSQSLGLADVWGEEFDKLYEKYEREGLFKKQVRAQKLWFAILDSQMETGMPHIMYKDACNRKSNQKNVGTIKCGSMFSDFVEYSSSDEIAAGVQASIALDRFVKKQTFDFQKLKEVTKVVTRDLDHIIDANLYCLSQAESSNRCHRPIGIGVQGLADTFTLMRYPFDSEKAQLLNKQIFETIYYAALESSCELAEKYGPYETYKDSPAAKGLLQYDLWNEEPTGMWDWKQLKHQIAKHGLRNSLLVAISPTPFTSCLLGDSNSIEPRASNMFTCRVKSEEFQVVNYHLLKDLMEKGLWDINMRNQIISNKGSIQDIEEIPSELKALYKTAWEIPQKPVVKLAAERGPFVDQSQCLNIHMSETSHTRLTSMHYFGWRAGLKTGMAALRTLPAIPIVDLSPVEVPQEKETEVVVSEERVRNLEAMVCSLQNKEACLMCSA